VDFAEKRKEIRVLRRVTTSWLAAEFRMLLREENRIGRGI
jgi:hypothetical protein